MTLADSLAVLLFVAVVAYAVLAGADFGAGFWDLLAGGSDRGARPRALAAKVIGPVWEANHVWLIFALVLLWTCFPTAFAAIGGTMFVPLSLVAIGVIMRGAAFAFRKEVDVLAQRRLFGAVFALSSVITPFFLGAIVGGIASARVPAEGRGDWLESWWNPTSVLGGVLAVLVCAFLAAVFLTADAHRVGDDDLTDYFRTRALAAAVVVGVVALGGIAVLREDAPTLFDGLTSGADLVLVPASAAAGTATIVLVVTHRYAAARVTAASAVVAVLAGWGVAQYPDLLVDALTIEAAAGARETLVAVWVCVAFGLVVLVPSLAYLFWLVGRGEIGATPAADDAREVRGRPTGG